ncbi:MAG: isoprenyl transferase [Chloroflexi bacterium]|nr:isoprenyl transferase [Chloroflexota bacterium]
MALRTDSRASDSPPAQRIPRHVAVIMDGNGRWAYQRGLPRLEGHRAATENIRKVIHAFSRYPVEYLTLYAFSTENWGRPDPEVNGLMGLLGEVIGRETKNLHTENVRLRHLGRLEHLPRELRQAAEKALALTEHNTGLTLCVAFDYGGRAEILDAVRAILRDGVSPEAITEDIFRRYLYAADIPDPDLIIRTSGEQRLSNFLLWQSAYSEYYCTPTLWPDFDAAEVDRAIEAYQQRQRRFGRLVSES